MSAGSIPYAVTAVAGIIAPMDAQQLHQAGIDSFHHFVGMGYTKLFEMAPGSTIGQHDHNKDHISVLLLGRVIIEAAGVRGEISAPRTINIPAGVAHEISAVEHSLWACVWSDAEGAITPDEFDAKVTP